MSSILIMKCFYIILTLFCNILSYNNTVANNITNKLNKIQVQKIINNNAPKINTVKKYEERLEEYFENGFKSFNEKFVQRSKNINDKEYREICNGTINILRNKKKPYMKIEYKNGEIQEIVMEGRFISITNRKTKKRKTYSILTTPLYALLSGKMKLSELKPSIISNKNNVTVYIKNDKQRITLVFSLKIVNNESQIDKLTEWEVKDGNTVINVTINQQSTGFVIKSMPN